MGWSSTTSIFEGNIAKEESRKWRWVQGLAGGQFVVRCQVYRPLGLSIGLQLRGFSAGTKTSVRYTPLALSRCALTVFFINIATVMGPTPPGTGVIFPAIKLTDEK